VNVGSYTGQGNFFNERLLLSRKRIYFLELGIEARHLFIYSLINGGVNSSD
jgi:hypothetical protein